MKTFAIGGLALLGLTMVFLPVAQAADNEETELEGVWQQTKLVVDGEVKPVAADARLTIHGHTSKLVANGKVVFEGEFKIDATKTPKALVGVYKDGPNKGKKSESIYKIEGDKVTFCRGPIGGERPTEFVSKPGGLLSEYKRIDK